MNRKIFFDLDGTLSDPSRRLYNLFMELVPEARFTFEEYWEVKRNRTAQDSLLKQFFRYAPEQITHFKKSWLANVEDENRLASDRSFPGVDGLLSALAKDHDLYIVTARQSPALAFQQIEGFGWSGHFRSVFVTQQSISKAALVKESLETNPFDIFVGDTGEDILTAHELGVISVAVCSGFLYGKVLKEYHPDYLIESVANLYETDLIQPR